MGRPETFDLFRSRPFTSGRFFFLPLMLATVVMDVGMIVVMVPVIVTMAVVVRMRVRRTGFGIEGGGERRHDRAETAQHLFQHMIAADTDAVTDYLHVGVPVAEMPGQPHEIARRICLDFRELFRLTADAHNGAILKDQPIAVAQRHRLLEIEQDSCALLAREHNAPPLAVVGIKDGTIDGGAFGPLAGQRDG